MSNSCCCVCSDERGWHENPIVYCDGPGCDIAVHQGCYGIVTVPSGNWYCRKCEEHDNSDPVRCELCPSSEGALKKTDNNGWAHVVCALYIPEVTFASVSTMEPIILSKIPQERFGKACYICIQNDKQDKATIGACMECSKPDCKLYFHVTCAQSLKLLCEEDGTAPGNVNYCGYCNDHIKTVRKRHSFSFGNQKQSSTSSEVSEIKARATTKSTRARSVDETRTRKMSDATSNSTSKKFKANVKIEPLDTTETFNDTDDDEDDFGELQILHEPNLSLQNKDVTVKSEPGLVEKDSSKVNDFSDGDNDSTSIRECQAQNKNCKNVFEEGLSAPHMLGNQLNPASTMAQKMSDTLYAEIEDHSIFTTADSVNNFGTHLVGPQLYHKMVANAGCGFHGDHDLKSSKSCVPQTLEQLLERQWENGNFVLLQQRKHFDAASLLLGLHQIKLENKKLEDVIKSLQTQVNNLTEENKKLEETIESELTSGDLQNEKSENRKPEHFPDDRRHYVTRPETSRGSQTREKAEGTATGNGHNQYQQPATYQNLPYHQNGFGGLPSLHPKIQNNNAQYKRE